LKETTKHSFGRILWTGIKGVSMYFFIAFFFLLSIIIETKKGVNKIWYIHNILKSRKTLQQWKKY
jgi:hypothetical protein